MQKDKREKNVDTIAALATPAGRGGVGILRVSGPLACDIALKIIGAVPQPRYATRCAFKDRHQIVIDEGIALFFPNPHSFTGEDVLELQGHGGPVVLDQLLQCVMGHGAILARPGEFSERAFLNGKIDLTQAEAVADLINAQSVDAARSATRSLQGDFSKRIQALLQSLIELRVFVEAAIDFPEEEVDFIGESQLNHNLKNLIAEIETIEKTAEQGALLQEGLRLVILGKPNAGKSSLLNALTGRETAIVTDIPGTTRDVLSEAIHIDGLPLHVVDTAGLRETSHVVEQEGIRRAWQEAEKADIALWVRDATQSAEALPDHLTVPVLVVENKIDLVTDKQTEQPAWEHPVIRLSAKTGEGVECLREHLKQHMGYQKTEEGAFSARQRHIDALRRAKASLTRGALQLSDYQAGELLAEELRHAQQALGEITGVFTSDDLLGEIFSSFCIGK